MVTRKWWRNLFNTYKGKYVVAEKFIRNLQNLETCDFIIKNVHIDKLDDVVNK